MMMTVHDTYAQINKVAQHAVATRLIKREPTKRDEVASSPFGSHQASAQSAEPPRCVNLSDSSFGDNGGRKYALGDSRNIELLRRQRDVEMTDDLEEEDFDLQYSQPESDLHNKRCQFVSGLAHDPPEDSRKLALQPRMSSSSPISKASRW